MAKYFDNSLLTPQQAEYVSNILKKVAPAADEILKPLGYWRSKNDIRCWRSSFDEEVCLNFSVDINTDLYCRFCVSYTFGLLNINYYKVISVGGRTVFHVDELTVELVSSAAHIAVSTIIRPYLNDRNNINFSFPEWKGTAAINSSDRLVIMTDVELKALGFRGPDYEPKRTSGQSSRHYFIIDDKNIILSVSIIALEKGFEAKISFDTDPLRIMSLHHICSENDIHYMMKVILQYGDKRS